MDDEELRKLWKPKVSESDALVLLRRLADVTAECSVLQSLDSYDDVNFHVNINGISFLLKIHNGVESRDYLKDRESSVIHLQLKIMEKLKEANIPSNQLRQIALHECEVQNGQQQQLVCKLLTWLEGTPMSNVKHLAISSLFEAGEVLARLGLALETLKDHAAAHRFHAWDGKHTAKIKKFVQYIKDERRQGLVQSILQAFDKLIESGETDKFRTGLNHADFNDANIIQSNGHVTGVIDFGDSVHR